jgi:transcriptional regulator of heat shock response
MIKLLEKYWYVLVILILAVLMYLQHKRIAEIESQKPKQPDKTLDKIKELRDSVENLVDETVELQNAYDNKQTTIINNIIKKNETDTKKVNDIILYTDAQRDSVWSGKSSTEEDNISGRYWGVLYEKTGGRNPKELGIQRDFQK